MILNLSPFFTDLENAPLTLTLVPLTPSYITNVGLVITIAPTYAVPGAFFFVYFTVSDGVNVIY